MNICPICADSLTQSRPSYFVFGNFDLVPITMYTCITLKRLQKKVGGKKSLLEPTYVLTKILEYTPGPPHFTNKHLRIIIDYIHTKNVYITCLITTNSWSDIYLR